MHNKEKQQIQMRNYSTIPAFLHDKKRQAIFYYQNIITLLLIVFAALFHFRKESPGVPNYSQVLIRPPVCPKGPNICNFSPFALITVWVNHTMRMRRHTGRQTHTHTHTHPQSHLWCCGFTVSCWAVIILEMGLLLSQWVLYYHSEPKNKNPRQTDVGTRKHTSVWCGSVG